jgi:hypothetical protein
VNSRTTLFIAVFVGAALLVGCAHSIRVKAVDAITGQPLAGVATEWRQNRHQMFQLIAHTGPIHLSPSDHDGLIEVRPIYRTWSSQFVFSLPGYQNVYGHYSWHRDLVVCTDVSYITSGQLEGEFRFEGKMEVASKSNWCFLVRMQK